SRTSRARREMSPHRVHLDGRQQVVDERYMLVPKLATVHQMAHPGYFVRPSVPGDQRAVPSIPASSRAGESSPKMTDRLTGTARLGLGARSPSMVRKCHNKNGTARGGPVSMRSTLASRQSIFGSMIDANALRARLSRDFTVPRLQSVISAISSYDLPSSSRSTNT